VLGRMIPPCAWKLVHLPRAMESAAGTGGPVTRSDRPHAHGKALRDRPDVRGREPR
jgi:hypothetical protein